VGFFVVQQHRCRIAALEDQAALVGTHFSVVALVRNRHLVDFKEVVEKAFLLVDFNLVGPWHCTLQCSPSS